MFILLKAFDSIKEYHVKEIQINQVANEFIAVLKSRLSGNKNLKFNLSQISAELTTNNTKFFTKSPATLFIYLPEKKYFKITNRYGFSTTTLIEINSALNNKQTPGVI